MRKSSGGLSQGSASLLGDVRTVTDGSMKAEFLAGWKEEFQETNYQPTAILLFTYLSVPAFGLFYLISVGELSKQGFGYWRYVPNSPYLLSILICFILAVLFSLRKYRWFCARNYEMLVTLFLVQYFLAMALPAWLAEVGNVTFDRKSTLLAYNSTRNNGRFQRICIELDPVKVRILSASDKPSGCDSQVIDGRRMGLYVNAFLELMVFNLHWKRTFVLSVYMLVFVGIAVLASGTYSLALITSSIFFLFAGVSSSFFCSSRHENEEQLFAIAKRTRFASEQSRNLVNTLMPENVLSRIAPLKSREFVGMKIPRCTIMFCSLAPQEVIQQESSRKIFHLLDEIFETFDSQVELHGMYKYQHVGEWYIITCPRGAAPFDEAEQSRSYPPAYASMMVMLAKRLIDIAGELTIGSTRLSLKVGISHGSVAGAVIGIHRAFYCVYGDTTNTAARMCKYSQGSQILCTRDFVELLKDCTTLDAECRSEGTIDVKGKGPMQVYSVQVRTSADQIAMATRAASISGASISSLSPSVVGMKMEHLSAQSRALLKGEQYRISRLWCTFTHASSEELFLSQSLRMHRLKLSIGIAFHVCAVILQFHRIVFPEYSYNYGELGAPELEDEKRTVLVALTGHVAVLFLWSAGAFIAMWTCHIELRMVQWTFVVMKLAFLSVSLYVNKHQAPLSWTLYFPFIFVVAQSNSCGVQAAQALNVLVVSTATLLSWTISQSSRSDVLQNLLIVLLTGVVAFVVARLSEHSERFRWRMHQVFSIESTRLREILSDLMPASVAEDMLSHARKQPCQQELAVVLELDLCDFTRLSQGTDPMALANMIHRVFSRFDLIVQDKGLFKMDTVGDAYIVAGWLPRERSWMSRKESKEVCAAVLHLARSMLSIVQEQSLGEGRTLSCRIGISVGMVATGLLGKIQSRFHMMGQALREAEQLEHDAPVNSVHVCDTLLQALALDGSDIRLPALGADREEARADGSCLKVLVEHGSHEEEEARNSSKQGRGDASEVYLQIRDIVSPEGWELVETRVFRPPPCSEEEGNLEEGEGDSSESLKLLLPPPSTSHVLKQDPNMVSVRSDLL